MTTDHVGSTSAHHLPHTKFRHCSPYGTLDICLSCSCYLANQNRYANEVLNMHTGWRQITWVVFVSTTIHIPSFMKIGHCLHAEVYVLLRSNLHTYIQTTWQRKSKWSFQQSWQPTKNNNSKTIIENCLCSTNYTISCIFTKEGITSIDSNIFLLTNGCIDAFFHSC